MNKKDIGFLILRWIFVLTIWAEILLSKAHINDGYVILFILFTTFLMAEDVVNWKEY